MLLRARLPWRPLVHHVRYAATKRKEVVVDIDLPQGMIAAAPLLDEEKPIGFPRVIQQARNNMDKYNHCVVLTRVGNFYELYFEQAEEWGQLLGLKVATRKASGHRVAMAGFPFYQLDRYLKALVQDYRKYVAISEEIPNDASARVKAGGNQFDRQVRRVITPGTLIDEAFLIPYQHNYVLAVTRSENFGIAWLDLSSGEFYTQTTDLRDLATTIARISPREIVIDGEDVKKVISLAGEHVITQHQAVENPDWRTLFSDETPELPAEEEASTKLLLDYVKSQLPGLTLRLQAPERRKTEEYMSIDRHSLRGLEIVRTIRDGVLKGSLLHAVKRTVTDSGERLLLHRLIINDRLDLVQALLADAELGEEIEGLLRKTGDTLRMMQRFSLGRGSADDLLSLSQTIGITQQVRERLSKHDKPLQQLSERFKLQGPSDLAKDIAEAIDEEGLASRHQSEEADSASAAELAQSVLESSATDPDSIALRATHGFKSLPKAKPAVEDRTDDIWIMRPHASKTLKKLHQNLADLIEEKAQLAVHLRETLGATSLALKFTPGLGHICHIRGKDTKLSFSSLENTRTVSSSKSTRSFYLPAWTTLGGKIETAKARIRAEEQTIFQSLADLVIRNIIPLRRNASILDELDVALSSAKLAAELRLKRPIVNHSTDLFVKGGRHIVVDTGLASEGRMFTPNDCHLGSAKIWLITGPNMAGKSTFLRQTALISILAQTGMFVPAEWAELGLVDRIFSRIGSADNLSQDQSTFMVEMIETADILRQATPRSFVIMDEVGRGTTPEDGVAVGYAVLKHLSEVNQCRTLFATHFHGLADMTADWPGVARYSTKVEEDGRGFYYDYRMQPGVERNSHALKVARLAGMPEEAIATAQKVIAEMSKPAG